MTIEETTDLDAQPVRRSSRRKNDINYSKLNSGHDGISSESDDEVIPNQEAARLHRKENQQIQTPSPTLPSNSPSSPTPPSSPSSQFPFQTHDPPADFVTRVELTDFKDHICNELTCVAAILDDPGTRINKIEDDINSLTDFVRNLFQQVMREKDCTHNSTKDRIKELEEENALLQSALDNSSELLEDILNEKIQNIHIQTETEQEAGQWNCVGPQKQKNGMQMRSTAGQGDTLTLQQNQKGSLLSNQWIQDELPSIKLSNTFAPLAYPINDQSNFTGYESDTVLSNKEPTQDKNALKSITTKQTGRPIIPGNRLYSEVHISKVAIVSDSMSGRMRTNELNCYLQEQEERAIISKNPGATARQIKHNSAFIIQEEDPDVLVVVAGVNDILYGSKHGQTSNEHTVAKDILDIARQAKELGVKTVYVSSIMAMSNSRLDRQRNRVNTLIKSACIEEGFGYFPHENITQHDLAWDNLHLNRRGQMVLMDNILVSCCSTYNPYLDYIYDYDDIL